MPLDSILSASLQSWLGHELEMRGIDAIIYTRYILSILQQDNLDAELGEAVFFPPSKKVLVSPGIISNSTTSQVTTKVGVKAPKGKKVDKKRLVSMTAQEMNSEQRKKSAAVECLLSVTDEDSGIENLVDELYLKLKAQGSKVDGSSCEAGVNAESSDSVISTSPEDPAERYYAAFPALIDGGEVPKLTKIGSTTPAWPKLSQNSPSSEDDRKQGQLEMHIGSESVSLSATHKDGPTTQQFSRSPSQAGSHCSQKRHSPRDNRAGQNHRFDYESRRTPSWDDYSFRPEKYWDSKQHFFRSGSQEKVIRRSPRMSRKKSWPDFEHYAQPSFIVPKMPTQVKPLGLLCTTGADGGVTQGTVSPGKISLQDIFGTEQVREIVPCKTLVVDGQLVRLCATSVNSNNLEKTAKVDFSEAPMEELVALKLQQEVKHLSKVSEARAVQAVHCSEAVSSEDLVCEAEDLAWYTGPLNQLLPKSPQPKVPLFKRNKSEHGTSEQADSEGEQASLATTPTYTMLWEDVLDDNGVYVGARLQDSENLTKTAEQQCNTERVKDSGSDSSDYVDMTVATHLLHDLFDEEYTIKEDPKNTEGDVHKSKNESVEENSSERLNVFTILAQDGEDATLCSCGAVNSDVGQDDKVVPSHMADKLFVSQYKGCLIPEITQNKVPDDRPLFFLDEQELNNNNHSEHAKVAMHELWSDVDCCSNCIVTPNLFLSLYTSLSTVSSDYSSIWNNDAMALKSHRERDQFNRAPGSKALFASKYPESLTSDLFDFATSAAWPSDVSLPRLPMFLSPVSLFDAIWGEPILDSPPKIWDINNSRRLEGDSPRECSNTLENMNKYLMNLYLNKEPEVNRSDVEFIEGGLYGGTLNSDDAWSTTRSDCSEDEGICDSDTTWTDIAVNKHQMFQSRSADDFSHWIFHDDLPHNLQMNVWTNKLTGSMQLLHSETSAFSSDSLPSRLPHIPHVQSEPSMSQRQAKWSGGKHRLVQVKHLYKPDRSILKTLGLDSDEDEDYKPDDVEISPDRHFKPITTPLSRPGQHVQCVGDVYMYNYCISISTVKKEEDEETATLTGSCGYVADCLEELSMLSSSCGSGSYQMYHGEETIDVSFIPRFRVFKEHKLIQTGEDDVDPTKEMEQGLSERLLGDMKRVLTIDEEDEESEADPNAGITMKDLDRSLETSGDCNVMVDSSAGEPAWPCDSSRVSSPTPQAMTKVWADSSGISDEVWPTSAVQSAISSPTPQDIAKLWGDVSSDEVWPTSAVQSAISSPTPQDIAKLWGDVSSDEVWPTSAVQSAISSPTPQDITKLWGDVSSDEVWPTSAVQSAISSPTPQDIAKLWGDVSSDEVWPTSAVQSAISSPTPQDITKLWGDVSSGEVWPTSAVQSAISSPTPQDIAKLWGDVSSDEVWPTSAIQSAISSPTPQDISKLWGDADGTKELFEVSEVRDLMMPLPSASSIWGYEGMESSDGLLSSLCLGREVQDIDTNCTTLNHQPSESSAEYLTDIPLLPVEGYVKGISLPVEQKVEVIQHMVDTFPVLLPVEHYMPDVVLEVSAMSHGMTPGSLPDILLHDSITAETMLNPENNNKNLNQDNKDDNEEIPEHGSKNNKLNPAGIFNLDVSFEKSLSNKPSDFIDYGGEADDKYAAGLGDYGGWSLAEADLSADGHDEQEPEWLQDHDDDDESGDMMFAMDLDVSGDKSSSESPVTGTLTNYFKPINQPEVPSHNAVYSSDLESSWLHDDQTFVVQVPHRVSKTAGSGRKPCTFFMEGNCRRADCRFAHDTSQITCRFWEEGDCFKGITCPFLHGYHSAKNKTTEPIEHPEDFSLENTEFPELGKDPEREPSFSSVPSTNKSMQPSDKPPVGKVTLTTADTPTRLRTSCPTDGSTYTKYKNLRAKLKQKSKSLPIDVSCKNKG